MAPLEQLLRDAGVNAILAWALVGVLLATAGLAAFTGQFLWGGFALGVVGIALIPPAVLGSPRVMLPWEVLLCAGLPILGRSVLSPAATGLWTTYLSVAALALIVAVELHLFTTVRMSAGFAVLFVTVTTIAVAGIWAMVRWLSDGYLGSELLLTPGVPESAIERSLMIEFVVATVIGVLAGVVFEFYVRRRDTVEQRVPVEAA